MDRGGCVAAADAINSCLIGQVSKMSLQTGPYLFVWWFLTHYHIYIEKERSAWMLAFGRYEI